MSRAVPAPSDRLLATVVTERDGARRLVDALRSAGVGVVVVGGDRFSAEHATGGPRVDPTVVALELGRADPDLGVLVAVAPTRDHPYNTARRILSIDHLLGGRAGVVLGGPDRGTVAAPRGTAWTDAPEDDALLREYADVLRSLWSTWPIETIVADRETGVFADPSGIRRLDHGGAWRIGGALTTPTGPQGEPVLAVLDGVGPLDDADLVVEAVRVDELGALGLHGGSGPDGASGPDGTPDPDGSRSADAGRRRDSGGTLRDRLGLPERRRDLHDRAHAFSATAAATTATSTGGTR